jgi:hypothetical protein
VHTAGEPAEGKRKIWVIARQHPGESMAEWFMEGLLHRLLDSHDPVTRKALKQAVFYLVRAHSPPRPRLALYTPSCAGFTVRQSCRGRVEGVWGAMRAG